MATALKGNVYGHTYPIAAPTPVLGGTFVKLVTDGNGGTQLAPCGAGQAAFGANHYDAGDTGQTKQATVQRGGRRRMIAGAAINAPAYVMADATARPVTYVAGAGVFALGIADSSPAGAGAEVVVYLFEAPCQP
jgi:hypothetical protein